MDIHALKEDGFTGGMGEALLDLTRRTGDGLGLTGGSGGGLDRIIEGLGFVEGTGGGLDRTREGLGLTGGTGGGGLDRTREGLQWTW